jgi:deoxyribodipyrimidine photo-lyase
MTSLPLPLPGRAAAEEYVARHLAPLVCDEVRGSQSFTGGQAAADAALAAFDVTGYASRRNEVLPASRRGASRLSPYIRHGLLSLPEVWDHVADGPRRDVEKFRDELLWQEFARH